MIVFAFWCVRPRLWHGAKYRSDAWIAAAGQVVNALVWAAAVRPWSRVQLGTLVAEAVVDCYDEDGLFAGQMASGLPRIEHSAFGSRLEADTSFRRLFGSTSVLVAGPSLPGDSSVDNINRVSIRL